MRIFIDSAKLEEIELAASYGILDGVTTNPSLIKKAIENRKGKKLDMKDYIDEILKVAKGKPVSLEVAGSNHDDMVAEAKKLYKMFHYKGNVNIKIPIDPSVDGKDNHFDGLKVIKELADFRIPVNATLIFTPEQALMAAKAGANFVSPFAGRVDDFIRDSNKIPYEKEFYYPCDGIQGKGGILEDRGIISGVDLVKKCVDILEGKGFRTEVIAASIRNARQARECAFAGAHIATLPLEVMQELLVHPKTEEGMKSFMKDVVPEYAKLLKD